MYLYITYNLLLDYFILRCVLLQPSLLSTLTWRPPEIHIHTHKHRTKCKSKIINKTLSFNLGWFMSKICCMSVWISPTINFCCCLRCQGDGWKHLALYHFSWSYQRGRVSWDKRHFLPCFSFQSCKRWNWPRAWPVELCSTEYTGTLHEEIHSAHLLLVSPSYLQKCLKVLPSPLFLEGGASRP